MILRHTKCPLVALFLLMASHAAGQCCDYTLSMHDSYGDGWNGGSLQVSVNGSVVGNYAAGGYASSAAFTVCNDDQLELSYSAGDWENENTYWLLDAAGNVLFVDGPDPEVGLV